MNIKIYIASHKEVQVLNNTIFKPIQLGCALQKERFVDYLYDDIGENISACSTYNELRAIYWAWKNKDADYYGLMHYRRYFSFDESKKESYIQYNNMRTAISENKYDLVHIEHLISSADIIMPIGVKMQETVYEQYKADVYHNINDLDIVLQIIREKYPEYQQAAELYMKSKEHYICNMFIMKKDIFNQYCEWLFDILSEHEKRASFENYNQQQYRVTGYLAERLLGIFYTNIKMNSNLVCKELARIHFEPMTISQPIKKPQTSKTIVPVVFSVNEEYIPYLAVAMQSLLDNSSKNYFYHLVVLHTDSIQENSKQKLIQLENIKDNCRIDFYNVSTYSENFINLSTVEGWFRLFVLDVLPFYEKVVCLDCDVILQKDVAELYKIELKDYYLAAVKDLDYIGQFKINKKRRKYVTDVLSMRDGLKYFQTGVLVLNLTELRADFSVKQLVEIALTKKWMYKDMLNSISDGKVLFLPQQWNVLINRKHEKNERMEILKQAPLQLYQEYSNARKNPFIIHYAGAKKPWNSSTCDFDYAFWKYARKTAFYENILFQNNSINNLKYKIINKLLKKTKNVLLMVVNKFLPINSKRRLVMKSICEYLYSKKFNEKK